MSDEIEVKSAEEAVAVDIGVADDMRGQRALRIQPPHFGLEFQARFAELEDGVLLRGGEIWGSGRPVGPQNI